MDFNLRIFRKQKGLTQKQIASFLGVGQPFVSQMESGKDRMPDEYVSRLIDEFGEIDDADVKGMDNSQPSIDSGKVIPYYDAEVAAGTQYGMEMTPAAPAGWIEIGGILKDSEFAMRVYGNSMVPNYPAGCVIGLRRYTENFIEPGTVYVIETTENRFLKRLYYNDDKTAFSCISDNHMKHESGPREGKYFYPEFEIPLEDVKRLFRVTGVIKRNVM